MVEFVILGRTELRVQGRSVDLGAAKQRALLALLLYHVGSPVRLDVLTKHLWPGQQPERYRTNLHTLVSRLRAVLHSVDLPDALPRIPSTGAYRLDVPPAAIDYHRFRLDLVQAREAARRGDYARSVGLLREGISLWHDEPLADLHADDADQLREAMRDTLLQAYQCMGDCQLQLGDHDAALAWLEPAVAMHPLDEMIAQQWIRALCAAGRRAEARNFLTHFRARFRKVLRVESSIDMPAPLRPAPAAGAASQPSASRGPRQLPNDIPDFTGHQELLAQLSDLTEAAAWGPRTIGISGMPGVGKTTLAVHWAHLQRHRFPDGQLYLNANAYGPAPPIEAADILGRLLRALDVPPDQIPPGIERRRDRLRETLANRTVLIVLDNVRDSEQVRPLLPVSDTCLMLITSRVRLRGLRIREGVPNITVPPLPDEASRQLLARAIGSRADREPAAVQAMARLSGGLPLALRIIGEHIATRPVARIDDLVDELATRLLDCEGDDETTLRTVFAWSHAALRPEAARLFTVLGLHPGETVSVESAAALNATAPAQTEALLDNLAKAHLINHDTVRRYRLHDLLRQYAADRVTQEEPAEHRQAAGQRLLDWYLHTAVSAAAILAPHEPPVPDLVDSEVRPQSFASAQDAMKWCEAERSNIGAVTRWAVEHGWYRHAWQIPGTVNELLDRYGPQDDVRELHETALRAARLDDHPIGELGTLNNLAATYFAQHDHVRAAATFTDGLNLARQLGAVPAETICLHNLASVHLASGDAAVAVELLHQALERWRALDHPAGEASTLHRLGEAHRLMRHHPQAAAYYQQALSIREQIDSLRGQGATHRELAELYLDTDQWDLALEHGQKALSIHIQTKDDLARCDALTTIAEVQRHRGMRHQSVRAARLALALSEEIADPLRRCRALTTLTDVLLMAGHARAAQRACDEALALVPQLTAPEAEALQDRLVGLWQDIELTGGTAAS